MRLTKDVLAIGAILPLGVLAIVLTQSSAEQQRGHAGEADPAAASLADPAEGTVERVVYRVEGGSPTIRFTEIVLEGPGDLRVRHQRHGGPVEAFRRPWSSEQHERLLALLGEVRFFDAEEVGRRGLFADLPTTTIQVERDGRTKEIVIDARTRSTIDLDPLVAHLDAARRDASAAAPAAAPR